MKLCVGYPRIFLSHADPSSVAGRLEPKALGKAFRSGSLGSPVSSAGLHPLCSVDLLHGSPTKEKRYWLFRNDCHRLVQAKSSDEAAVVTTTSSQAEKQTEGQTRMAGPPAEGKRSTVSPWRGTCKEDNNAEGTK